MTRPVHALVLGVTLGLLGQSSFATTTEQKGQPEQSVVAVDVQQKGHPDSSIAVMKSYGVDVPTSNGLRSVVPAGWHTYAHPAITLQDTMSWKLGDRWTDVVGKLAKASHAVVLVDWDEKSVYIRSEEVALDQDAKQAEVLQAATTPLPRFDSPAASLRAQTPLAAATEAVPVTLAGSEGPSHPAPIASVSHETVVAHLQSDAGSLKPAQPSVAQPLAAQPKTALAATTATAAPAPAGGDPARVALEKSLAPSEEVVNIPVANPKAPVAAVASLPAGQSSVVVGGPIAIAASQPAVAAPLTPAHPEANAASMAAALTNATDHTATSSRPAAVASTSTLISSVAPSVHSLSTTADFSYTEPVALSKPQARVVAQGIAQRFGLRLVWAAPDVHLNGPVTLLGNTADEDVDLLHKALGVYSPLSLQVPAGQGVLLVQSTTGAYPDLAAQAPSAQVAQVTAVVAHVAAVSPVVRVQVPAPVAPVVAAPVTQVALAPVVVSAPVEPKAEPVVIASPTQAVPAVDLTLAKADTAPVLLTLDIRQGEQLNTAISRFAHTQLYTVDWQVPGGFEAKRDRTYQGKTLAEVLGAVLPSLGVSADIDTHHKNILVRPYDAARDQ